MGTYHTGYFHEGSNIYLNLIMCDDKIVIPSIIQSCVLHWYHAYILHTVMDRTEAIIIQHMYYPSIREAVRKEVTNGDTCKRTKRPKKKYGKFPDFQYEEIPWNKIFVDLIGPYVIRINVQKEKLNLKAVNVIYPVTGWFEITQYDDKREISITNLVETTWLRVPVWSWGGG